MKIPQKRKLAEREKKGEEEEGEGEGERETLLVEPYSIPNRGPYPYNQPKKYIVYRVLYTYMYV